MASSSLSIDIEKAPEIEEDEPKAAENKPKTTEGRASTSKKKGKKDPANQKMVYSLNDRPPLGVAFALGFQHYLTMVGGIISVPFILAPSFCILQDDPTRGHLISTLFLVSGISTVLQVMLGVRLPIIQGSSFTFIACTLAIMDLPQWQCPSHGDLYAMGQENRTEEWRSRMREIQGAIIAASTFEVFIGYFGLVGLVLRFITPLTITPTIALVGLSLVNRGSDLSSGNWYISVLTVTLIAIFSQYLRNFTIRIPVFSCKKGWREHRIRGFQLFPVLITAIIVYFICGVLTFTNILDESDPGRIDKNFNVVENTAWFRIPYPFQWGWPTFSFSSTFAMLAAVIAGIVESVSDYYACANISEHPPPPVRAVNRGVGAEGLGCVFAGVMGIGTGVTSFTENIGAIGVTRVASRKVVLCGATLMIILSFFGKLGAVFATLPTPVVGGLLCIMFSIVTAIGLSNLQYIDMTSPRNLFILGLSLFFGIGLPEWVKWNRDAIQTGILPLDQILTVLLTTHMFVGGFMGFVLDNTIPGSPDERGLDALRGEETKNEGNPDPQLEVYELPKFKWHRFAKVKEELTSLIRRNK